MIFEKNKVYQGFVLKEAKQMAELDMTGYFLTHEKTGAQLVYLETEDTNQVFSVTFKTLPTNHGGIAHIVEHAVCCASKKYPLKDTFMEMDKGSLNTALNACTYKDMTMYYAASQNEKDLKYLMQVYMDLIFNPMLYEDEQLFRQEGWHYEEESEDVLTYNGIVYNEMKGTFSEPGARLEKIVHEVLFEENCYAYDSGGVPEVITETTWEEALAFHETFYTPNQATFFLYGKGDCLGKMQVIDMYLSEEAPKRCGTPQKIEPQKAFEQPKRIEGVYPIGDEALKACRNYLNLTFVVGERIDGKLKLAFQVLEHMLLKSAASPLQQVLIEQEKIGTALATSGYDPGKYQPTFGITLTGCKGEGETFEPLFFKVLQQIVEEGVDTALLQAAIDTMTFSLYEGESEGEPLGILYSEDVQLGLYYTENPFEYLTYKQHLKELREEKGYFEQLIKTYFLENKHYVKICLKPSKTLQAKEEKKARKQLQTYAKHLTEQEKIDLNLMNEALEERQLAENTKEELACLPQLQLSDLVEIRKPIHYLKKQVQNVPVLGVVEQTRHISYYHVLCDASDVACSEWPYLGLLSTLLTYVSTSQTPYTELENRINSQMGACNCTINAYANTYDTNDYKPLFKLSVKMLDDKSVEGMALITEIMTQTRFDEKDKIKEIIDATVYDLERSFTGAPEYRATKRLYTGFSEAARFEDAVSGESYYQWLKALSEQDESGYEALGRELSRIYHQLMSKERLMISMMANEEQLENLFHASEKLIGTLDKSMQTIAQAVEQETISKTTYPIEEQATSKTTQEVKEEAIAEMTQEVEQQAIIKTTQEVEQQAIIKTTQAVQQQAIAKMTQVTEHQLVVKTKSSQFPALREAVMTSSDVQAVAWGGNVLDLREQSFTGAWYVVGQFLESNYLWDTIRLQGGAYGCDLTLSRDGNVSICSYCDPEIEKTLETYRMIGDYLENIQLDEETINRYIIKTIALMDYPLTMEQKSERALIHHLCGVTSETLTQERQQVLQTTLSDFRTLAKVFKQLAENEHYCVIGNQKKIKATKALYTSIQSI